MIAPRSFTSDWHASLTYADTDRAMLAQHFGVPVSQIRKTGKQEDKAGIDYVIWDEPPITVDMKRRRAGISHFWRTPTDPDIPVELWSKQEYGVPGPLFRDEPLPDYFGYAFADLPGQLYLLPAEPLRAVARLHREEWVTRYHELPTLTNTIEYGAYTSTFVPVPQSVVAVALSAYASVNGL